MTVGHPPQLLQRIERARRVVSLCSQATIRAYDEEALLSEACRILLDVGDYSMAWIGEAPASGGPPVVLAHASAAVSGVRSVDPPWMSDGGRRSPTVRAILEQRPQVLRGISNRPAEERRFTGTVPEGVAAVCAFPIQFGPHGAGVLTIYAREADAFAPEEVALLRELAGDLAVGIAGLRAKLAGDRLEAQLEGAERRLYSLIEHAPVAILQFNAEGKVMAANLALAQLVGYDSPAQIVAQTAAELAGHLEDADQETLLRALRAGPPFKPHEVKIHKLDRTRLWVEIQARTGEGANANVIDVFIRDLTPERTSQLFASRLEGVVDASEEAIIGIDREGVVVTWSRGATTLYGFEATEAMGHPLVDRYVPADRRVEWQTMLAVLAKGDRVPRFDTRRICKKNAIKDVSVAASPILDSEGHTVGASLIEHDISDRFNAEMARLAQERQRQEVSQLQAVAAMRSDFMNRASHELNTPLTPVLLQVQALREGAALDAKQTTGLALIERNVVRLATLVKDLLSASTISSGQLALRPAQFVVTDLITYVVASFQAQAQGRGVTLQVKSRGPTPAYADPDRVTQVLFNLIGNAVKYTSAHGAITVTAGESDGATIVEIADTGQGFGPEKQAQLFKPFGRLHDDVPGAPAGTGLGLFISKGIVEACGGTLTASSPGPGRGSTFTFSLPRSRPERPGHGIKSASGFRPLSVPTQEEPSVLGTARLPAADPVAPASPAVS